MRVLKKWIVSISFLVFLFIFIPTVHADEEQMYKVGIDKLEIKNAPNQEAEVIGQLVSGDKVNTFQEKSGWLKTFYRGDVAWVASQYLIPVNISSSEKPVYKKENQKKIKIIARNGKIINRLVEMNTVKPPQKLLGTTKIVTNEAKKSHPTDSLAGYRFIIDAGHGGKDGGATSHGVKEKNLTLSTAKQVASKLKEEGASVTLSRSDDSYISLDERVKISNESQIDAFISIHFNAFKDPDAEGISTFFSSGDQNKKLAQTIQTSLINHTGLYDRGAKQANYFVLHKNNKLAVLVELGFITNPKELERVQTTAYQEEVTEGISEGLKHYFN